MAYPATGVSTANLDSAGDSPALARADLKDLAEKFNDLRVELYRVSGLRPNWSSVGGMAAVVGMLGWTKWGNNHVVYDASSGQTPEGVPLPPGGDTDAQIAWSPGHPMLVGYNGTYTYGVRVDSARAADVAAQSWDSIGNAQSWSNVTGSRAAGIGYYNGTARPIGVLMGIQQGPSQIFNFQVNGITVLQINAPGSNQTYPFFVIVPPYASYGYFGTASILQWQELA